MKTRRSHAHRFVVTLSLLASLAAVGVAWAASQPGGAARQWASLWSWSVPLGGPTFGGVKTFVTVFNPADPDGSKSASATVSVKFYNGACKTGSLFSEGGGAQVIAPGAHALFFVYPEPASGLGGGCLLIESTEPVLPSGEIVAVSMNPGTGEHDSRSTDLAFWPVSWQPSEPAP